MGTIITYKLLIIPLLDTKLTLIPWHKIEYLCMSKQQFFNIIQNLMTNFHMEKISPFHFFNFLAWCEVETYAGDTTWHMKLIGVLNILISWHCLKTVLVCNLRIIYTTKLIISYILSFCKRLSLVPISASYHMLKLRFHEGGRIPSSPFLQTVFAKRALCTSD